MNSNQAPLFELTIVLADIPYAEEAMALRIFKNSFEGAGLLVRDSGQRTLLQSDEPPLRFVIELVQSNGAKMVEAYVAMQLANMTLKSVFQPTVDRMTSGSGNAFAKLWNALRDRYPKRGLQIELIVPGANGRTTYSLPGPAEADRAVAAIPADLDQVNPNVNSDRLWENDRWHSREDDLSSDQGRTGD